MSSFSTGMQMGLTAMNMASQNRLAQARLDMEQARHEQSMKEGGLRLGAMQRTEDATNKLFEVQNAGVRNQAAIDANNADFDMAVDATGKGLAMPQAAPMQQEFRPATDIDRNAAMSALAAAKGDVQGMETLRGARKGIEYDEGYKKHSAAWNAMDDNTKSELITKLSLDQGVRGFGSWVPGKGKTAGYMNYLPPGGDPIKLSAKEAGDLYALTNLMDVDPTRARAEMDKVSDKVRAVAAQAFEAQTKGVTANNTATHYANSDASEAAKGQYYRDRGAMDRMGSAQYFTGQDGNQYAAIPTMTKQGLQFETVRVNPEGVKLSKMANGATGKPVDVKDEGTKVMMDGRLVYADGMGGYIPANAQGNPAGYLPSQRPGVMKQHGIPDNLQGRVQWSTDGTGLRIGNSTKEYDPRNSEDMKALVKDASDYDIMDQRIAESMRQRMNPPREGGLAFGPKITYKPDPRAPGIYAGPEEWAAYRAQQNQK